MAKLIRSSMLVGAAALLAACSGDATTDTTTSDTQIAASGERTIYERPDDHAIGRVDAPLVVVEYASVTCPGCAAWHSNVYPEFKTRYVDTGKARYVFREFLTGNPTLAEAGFKIALCADEDDYFKNIKLQFDRFGQIMNMARNGQTREAYLNLAKASGLSEDEFATCLANEAHRDLINDKMQQGFDEGVTGTPAFFVNGQSVNLGTVESMDEVLSGLLGETVEEETPTEDPAE